MKKTEKILLFVCVFSMFCIESVFAKVRKTSKKKNEIVIVVGATPEPHAQMLELIVGDMKKAGYTLKIKKYADYVTPNEAVESGEIDANFFQHVPYMNSFNEEKGCHLVSIVGTHVEPLTLYSMKYLTKDKIPDDAVIAIPNDSTNEGRALLLLQSAGLIKLDPASGLTAVPADIIENPKNFKFHEIEAASLTGFLEEVDAAVINGNYAIPAGLTATNDGLFVEGADSPYVNIISVKDGRQNDPAIQTLAKLITSQKIKEFLKKTYPNGEVVPIF